MFFVDFSGLSWKNGKMEKWKIKSTPLIVSHLKKLLISLQNRHIFLLGETSIFYTFAVALAYAGRSMKT